MSTRRPARCRLHGVTHLRVYIVAESTPQTTETQVGYDPTPTKRSPTAGNYEFPVAIRASVSRPNLARYETTRELCTCSQSARIIPAARQRAPVLRACALNTVRPIIGAAAVTAVHCKKYPYIRGHFVASFPHFNGTGSVYFCTVNRWNNEALVHKISVDIRIFYSVAVLSAMHRRRVVTGWACPCGFNGGGGREPPLPPN